MQKRKDMRRSDWKRILKRDYIAQRYSYRGIDGIVSLILIQQITQPLTVRNGDHMVTIVDEGMSWLQMALRDQPVWVTAMFDRQDRLLQIYFDITGGNHLETEDNPTFEDLYLDIVMEPDGSLYVLDRDELDEALETGEITPSQHNAAVKTGAGLYQWLETNGSLFADECRMQMTVLKGMLQNGKDTAC